ncbi:hypothetical protein ACFSKM_14640 [Ancylobacter dichloromethanicus]
MPIIARLNGRFLLWFIALLPLTFGIGSFFIMAAAPLSRLPGR